MPLMCWRGWSRQTVLWSFLLLALSVPAVGAGASIVSSRPSSLLQGVSNVAQLATVPQAPLRSMPSTVFRDPPILEPWSGLYNHTILPYFGLGFSGGETADPNRQAARESAAQEQPSSRDHLGESFIPNEFQIGVRIPF